MTPVGCSVYFTDQLPGATAIMYVCSKVTHVKVEWCGRIFVDSLYYTKRLDHEDRVIFFSRLIDAIREYSGD
jgi:hypothetical protein